MTQATPHKRAVILLNMGGPTSIAGVESFLQNIFSDPLILRIKNRFIRKMVGSLIINKRLESVKQNYQKIGGCSPLPAYTFALCKQLEKLDSSLAATYVMRYTPPLALDVLRSLQDSGVDNIVLFSMYPQFSTTTTKSSLLDIHTHLQALSYKPIISVIEDFHDYAPFYELIADTITTTLGARKAQDFTLILSAHSLPQKIVDEGDPYPKQCQKGVEILREIFAQRGIEFANITLAYQSKVGPMRWLEPFTSDIIANASGQSLIIYPLAFTIDNAETIYELGIEYKELAEQSGVKEYLLCPCMNDSLPFAKMIHTLLQEKALDSSSTPS